MSGHEDEDGSWGRPEDVWKGSGGRTIRVPRWVIVGLVAVTGVLSFWTVWRVTTVMRARAAVVRLDRSDPGWRIEDIQARRESVPEGENSARVVEAALGLIPTDWLDQNRRLTRLKPFEQSWLPQDRWDVGVHEALRMRPVNERPDMGTLEQIRLGLGPVRPAIDRARGLVGFPRGRHTWSGVLSFPPASNPGATRLGLLTDLLAYEAMERAAGGDGDGAVWGLVARVNVAGSVGDEPSLYAQWVRSQVAADRETLERVLALSEPGEASLKELQERLEAEAEHPSLSIGLRGARGYLGSLLERAADGIPTPGVFVPTFERRVYYATQIRESQRAVLEELTRGIEMAESERPDDRYGLTRWHMGRLGRLWSQIDQYSSMYFYTACDMNTIRSLWDERSILAVEIAALACERYRRTEGRWPEDLNALVPRYLKRVPESPEGRAVRVKREGAGLQVAVDPPPLEEEEEEEEDKEMVVERYGVQVAEDRLPVFVGGMRLYGPTERGVRTLRELPEQVFATEGAGEPSP
jgi:hypothetical protein